MAHRTRATLTGRRRWTPRSPRRPTTSAPTHWSSSRAPRWPARSPPASSPAPDDDVLADRYVQADETLRPAGFEWYEVSNWATLAGCPLPAQRAVLERRELVGRRSRARTATSAACGGGMSSTRSATPRGWTPAQSPAAGRETLDAEQPAHRAGDARRPPRDGLPMHDCPSRPGARCPQLVTWGLVEPGCAGHASGSCSPSAVGCSPTPWFANCSEPSSPSAQADALRRPGTASRSSTRAWMDAGSPARPAAHGAGRPPDTARRATAPRAGTGRRRRWSPRLADDRGRARAWSWSAR